MMRWPECELCGARGGGLRASLVDWLDPAVIVDRGQLVRLGAAGPRFATRRRCTDESRCRRELERQGIAWPLVEHVAVTAGTRVIVSRETS